jgi:ADP-heptose:LPS heptosyltransferase
MHIVVIRLSAMGDVAMAVPVIKAVLKQHPHVQVTFVSNAFFAPLFAGIERCNFYPVYTKGTHQGLKGIWKLYRALAQLHADAVADLHAVLRSAILCKLFMLSGKKVAVIDKGRSEKKKLTVKAHKDLKQLPTSHERYAAVFAGLGLRVSIHDKDLVAAKENIPSSFIRFIQADKKLIAVAPFAQHNEKMYPLFKMKAFLMELSKRQDIQLLFFGAPGSEAALLKEWEQEIPSSLNVAGKISFAEELQLISNVNVMISMDSANMHLASIYGIPVVSIWGATHPYAGFYGWLQDENNIVQVDLHCRPCSVFGNIPCYRGDHACMHMITTLMLLQKTETFL